jgi:HlyD family secretion protein
VAVYSGTLQAPSAAVGSTLSGRVVKVLVAEGDSVHAGQVLLRFDSAQQRAVLASALGRLSQARATLADLRAGALPQDLKRAAAVAEQQLAQYSLAQSTRPYQTAVVDDRLRQALAQLADARAGARDARLDAARMRPLAATGDISTQQRDAVVARAEQADAKVSQSAAAVGAARAEAANEATVTLPESAAAALAAYHAARQQYALLEAGPRPEQVRKAEAAIRTAMADVAGARVQLDEDVVRAPAEGVVTAMDLHAGDLVAPGGSIATIDEAGNPYARIYVPQDELGRWTVGSHVAVRSDALPNARFDGVVEQIDARAQFTPENVQTADDRAVLSFGVKVRVRDPRRLLHPGTTIAASMP